MSNTLKYSAVLPARVYHGNSTYSLSVSITIYSFHQTAKVLDLIKHISEGKKNTQQNRDRISISDKGNLKISELATYIVMKDRRLSSRTSTDAHLLITPFLCSVGFPREYT